MPTLMSELKLLIFFQPAFSRWKLAQRSSSSSGDSFIRSSRVSPSLSSAARAVESKRQTSRWRTAHPTHLDSKMVFHSFQLGFTLSNYCAHRACAITSHQNVPLKFVQSGRPLGTPLTDISKLSDIEMKYVHWKN